MTNPDQQLQETHTPTWEKVLGVCGLLLLVSGIIYLSWTAIKENGAPPDVLFSVVEISQASNGFLVEVEINNKGSQSVAALHLEGHLAMESGSEETSHAEVDYLPSRSKSYAGFFFSTDPRNGTLTFRPSGYQEP